MTHTVVSHLSAGYSLSKHFFKVVPVSANDSLFQTVLLQQDGVELSKTAGKKSMVGRSSAA